MYMCTYWLGDSNTHLKSKNYVKYQKWQTFISLDKTKFYDYENLREMYGIEDEYNVNRFTYVQSIKEKINELYMNMYMIFPLQCFVVLIWKGLLVRYFFCFCRSRKHLDIGRLSLGCLCSPPPPNSLLSQCCAPPPAWGEIENKDMEELGDTNQFGDVIKWS